MARWQCLRNWLSIGWLGLERRVQQCVTGYDICNCTGLSVIFSPCEWKENGCLRATPPFVWQLPTCCLLPINSMKNEKLLVLESNTQPLMWYESHLCKQWGFLDCSQLLKMNLNGSLPINATTKAPGIYECYHIMDSCITDKRSWSSWPLVLWVLSLQIGPL